MGFWILEIHPSTVFGLRDLKGKETGDLEGWISLVWIIILKGRDLGGKGFSILFG